MFFSRGWPQPSIQWATLLPQRAPPARFIASSTFFACERDSILALYRADSALIAGVRPLARTSSAGSGLFWGPAHGVRSNAPRASACVTGSRLPPPAYFAVAAHSGASMPTFILVLAGIVIGLAWAPAGRSFTSGRLPTTPWHPPAPPPRRSRKTQKRKRRTRPRRSSFPPGSSRSSSRSSSMREHETPAPSSRRTISGWPSAKTRSIASSIRCRSRKNAR